MIKLREASLKLLIKCLRHHNPSLIPFVESNDSYTPDFYNELRGIVGDELCDKGFGLDSEPNEYGLELEALIDEIGRLFLYVNCSTEDFIPSIKVAFYISADEFNLEEVTRRLGVTPTKTRTKDSFSLQELARTIWCLSIEEENCCAISILFEKMLKILKDKSEIIKTVCGDYNLEASFEVVIHMQDGDSPEVALSREVISFAASVNAEIEFDLYCYK